MCVISFSLEEEVDVLVSAAAAVSQGLRRVGALQAGHVNRDPAGQWQHLCIHSQQPYNENLVKEGTSLSVSWVCLSVLSKSVTVKCISPLLSPMTWLRTRC